MRKFEIGETVKLQLYRCDEKVVDGTVVDKKGFIIKQYAVEYTYKEKEDGVTEYIRNIEWRYSSDIIKIHSGLLKEKGESYE